MRSLPVIALLTAKLLASTSSAYADAVGSAAAVRNDVRGTVAGQMSTGSGLIRPTPLPRQVEPDARARLAGHYR